MLQRENISDKLAKVIGRQIIHNELKSGEAIVETQIAKDWGISRSPVRDALHILEQKGLVEKTLRGSYTVLMLTADYIENFYDSINMFYQYSFSRATKQITDKDIEFLLALVEKIEKSVGYDDFDIYMEGISAFGFKVLEIANNPIIGKSASDLMPTAERIQFAAYQIEPSYLKKSLKYLRLCYENLSNRDPDKAAKSFKAFANTSRVVLSNHFKDTNSMPLKKDKGDKTPKG